MENNFGNAVLATNSFVSNVDVTKRRFGRITHLASKLTSR